MLDAARGETPQRGPGAPAPSPAPSPGSASGSARKRDRRAVTFFVEGLDCRGCARHAAQALRAAQGVLSAHVGYLSETAHVVFDARVTDEPRLFEALGRAGFTPSPIGEAAPSLRPGVDRGRLALALVLFVNMVGLVVLSTVDAGVDVRAMRLALSAAVIVLGGVPLARRTFSLCKRGWLRPEVWLAAGALVSLGLGAFGLLAELSPHLVAPLGLGFAGLGASQAFGPLELSATLVVVATFVAELEALIRRVAFRALRRRSEALAGRVLLWSEDESVRSAPKSELRPGDRVRLAEGEPVPADMILLEATDALEAPEDGEAGTDVEPRRVARAAGEALREGAIVLSPRAVGVVRSPSRLLAEQALDAETRCGIALAEAEAPAGGLRFSQVAARALGTAAVAFAIFAVVLEAGKDGLLSPSPWIALVATLAAAATTAFTVAAPLARTIALLRAREAGVLVRDAAAFERLASVDVASFERAALATGRPEVRAQGWLRPPSSEAERCRLDALLGQVAALEERAGHPVGRAIRRFLLASGVRTAAALEPGAVLESDAGIAARTSGALLRVGRVRSLEGAGLGLDLGPGSRAAFIVLRGEPVGWFSYDEPRRPDAEGALRALEGLGVAPEVLTGAPETASTALSLELRARASGGLSPAEKALVLRNHQHAGRRVLYVDDGQRLSLGAAHADVWVSALPPASGLAQAASSGAPIVLVDPKLTRLAYAIRLARRLRTRTRLAQGLSAALSALLVPAAAVGVLGPLEAAVLVTAEAFLVLGITAGLLRGDYTGDNAEVVPAAAGADAKAAEPSPEPSPDRLHDELSRPLRPSMERGAGRGGDASRRLAS